MASKRARKRQAQARARSERRTSMSKSVDLTATTPAADARRFHLPDGSRSAQSPWVWRGLFFMSLVAIGFCITLISGHHTLWGVLWGVIAAGWFGFSMWLWRQHVNYMNS